MSVELMKLIQAATWLVSQDYCSYTWCFVSTWVIWDLNIKAGGIKDVSQNQLLFQIQDFYHCEDTRFWTLIKVVLLFQPLHYTDVELAFYWQSWLKLERHGCSHGFHTTCPSDSWLSTGLTVLLCASTASSIALRMAWKAGSVSGVSGIVSDGSRDRSKSRGGLWYVTCSVVQKQTCVWKQAVPFSG